MKTFARVLAGALADQPIFRQMQTQLDTIMALQDDLNTKEQAISDAFTSFANELEGEVAGLKNQLANGQTPDLSGLDSLVASIKARTATDAAPTSTTTT